MRITYLLTQSLESPYGLGRCWPLARYFAQSGHQVKIAALHPDFQSLEETQFIRDGVRIHYVAPMHVRKVGNTKEYYSTRHLLGLTIRATNQLSRASLDDEADIIHLGKPHPMNSLAGVLASIIHGRTLFLDCDDFEAASNRFSGEWQRRIVAFFERWTPGHTDRVTTNTFFMRDKLISWGIPADKIIYIPNGIDRHRFSPVDPDRVKALREKLGVTGKQVVAFIGTLSLPSHPVDILIHAFGQVLNELPETIMLLIGGGEDVGYLKNLVMESGFLSSVRFVGRVSPDEVPVYYRLADVTVDPVNDDDAARGRCPLKLFESWASEVPFVTADVGDRSMLASDPPAALLSRPGDSTSLANSIIKVLQNHELANRLRQRGSERAREYDWEKLAKIMESAYLNQRS